MIELGEILAELYALIDEARNLGLYAASPVFMMQAGVLVAVFLTAHLARAWLDPKIEAKLRAGSIPPSRMRVYVVLRRRLRAFIFIGLIWAIVAALRYTTWPSRSYLLAVVASLVTAWVVFAVASRLIRNNTLSRAVGVMVFAFVALHILGLADEAAALLDSVAFSIGDLRFSLLFMVKAAVALTLLFWAAGVISGMAERRMSAAHDVSPSMRVLVAKLTRIVLYAIAAIVGLQTIGLDLTSITVLSGAIGVGIGFGLQKIVSNLISGFILLMDKSIKPGDVISLGDTFGWINSLGARYVSVETRDGREHLIPNEDLITGQVVNWSHTNLLVRQEIRFGVSYDSDPHLVRKIAVEALEPLERVVPEPSPVCHVTGFGDSSVDFVLRFWIDDPSKGVMNIKGRVLLALWDALKAAEVELPYPKRDLYVKELPERRARSETPAPEG